MINSIYTILFYKDQQRGLEKRFLEAIEDAIACIQEPLCYTVKLMKI